MAPPNREMEDLKSVEAEVVMVVTGVAATEVVEEDTVAETVVVAATEAVDLEGATKWEEEVIGGTTEETGHTKC